MLERSGDLAALLTNLEERDVLFIDEIHRLRPVIEDLSWSIIESLSDVPAVGPQSSVNRLAESNVCSGTVVPFLLIHRCGKWAPASHEGR